MTALVLVEDEGGAVKYATLAAVTAASKLSAVHALVAGDAADAVSIRPAQVRTHQHARGFPGMCAGNPRFGKYRRHPCLNIPVVIADCGGHAASSASLPLRRQSEEAAAKSIAVWEYAHAGQATGLRNWHAGITSAHWTRHFRPERIARFSIGRMKWPYTKE